jgi:hypothetical protein
LGTILLGTTIPYSRRYRIFVAPSRPSYISFGDSVSLSSLAFDNNYCRWPHNYTPYPIRCCTMAHAITLWSSSGPSPSPRLPHSSGATIELLLKLVIFSFALRAEDQTRLGSCFQCSYGRPFKTARRIVHTRDGLPSTPKVLSIGRTSQLEENSETNHVIVTRKEEKRF